MQFFDQSMQKIKFFNVEWTLKNKHLQQLHHFKLLKIKNIYIKKVSMHSLIIFSFDNAFIFNFYFDTTLTFFLSPHLSVFFMSQT
jgi:hypothetical protein